MFINSTGSMLQPVRNYEKNFAQSKIVKRAV